MTDAPALRTGFTTGACAAAAAKGAVEALLGNPRDTVEITLPGGERPRFALEFARRNTETSAEAGVRKYSGDDPDITNGAQLIANVRWANDGLISFQAGDGVGTVTKPGLCLPPGEPAINPAPRRMIEQAVRDLTTRGVQVTISIPGGRELALKTFNPRLGIVGGLSILGTTGIVRPFSCEAVRDTVRCAVSVCAASGVSTPVFVPGNIGERAARRNFRLQTDQVVEAGNEWGFALDVAREHSFLKILLVGHPGKLGKLPAGEWDTHSSRSAGALDALPPILAEAGLPSLPEGVSTMEGFFAGLGETERHRTANALAEQVRLAAEKRLDGKIPASVALCNMAENILGTAGDLTPWS